MPKLEIDIQPDTLAELGYTAFVETQRDTALQSMNSGYIFPQWDDAPITLRNFWRAWAREFVRQQMGV